jgi:hypothetical protein
MSEEKESPRGFRVTDRRRFSEEGEAKPAEEAEEVPVAQSSESPAAAHGEEEPEEPHFRAPEEPVSFSTFVLGLSTQALFHLGEIADPSTGQADADLAAAKHVIDILGILKTKTQNNLEQAEERLLDAVLYDLRLKFVELVRAAPKEGA